MTDIQSLYQAAVAEHRSGRADATEKLCRQILSQDEFIARAWDLLGIALDDMGDAAKAIECFNRAISLEPLRPGFYHNLGNALLSAGLLSEAERAYRRSLALAPGNIAALHTLGKVLYNLGRSDEAASVLRQAVAQVAATAPEGLGYVYGELGQTSEAIEAYRQAYELSLDPALRIRGALQLPLVYESREDVLQWRNRLIREVDALLAEGVVQDIENRSATLLFHLAHQGFNDVEIQRKLARLYRPAPLPPPARPAHDDGRVRVGFLSAYFTAHTIGKLARGLITRLSRADFHVTLFSFGQLHDPIAREIAASADRTVVLPSDIALARKAVLENPVDVLVFPEIGMDPRTYTLACSRLAPVQCTTWGHSETTGLDTMDYFVSSALLETGTADAHYSERLVRLPGLTFYFYRPERPAQRVDHAAFRLDSTKRLYGCPQTIYKFHPDFDEAMAGVLRGDPNGQIVLIQWSYPQPDDLLRRRYARTMPDVANRIVFIPRLRQPEFTNFLTLVDVLLDPFPYGGCMSTLEALALGVPVVTLPTELLRGRFTQAFCQRVGAEACIARDVQDYIDIAVRLGTDLSFREQAKERIVAGQSRLFQDDSAVRDWEDFFRSAVEIS